MALLVLTVGDLCVGGPTGLECAEAAGVDMVLSGHSHSYERTVLLDRHYGISSTLTSAQKVVMHSWWNTPPLLPSPSHHRSPFTPTLPPPPPSPSPATVDQRWEWESQ